MPSLQDHLRATPASLWLDSTAYAEALLAGGHAPWDDVAACSAWLRQAQGLLRSDAVLLPAHAVCQAWLQAHPALHGAVAGPHRRAVGPVRTLLADEGWRAHLAALLAALHAAFSHTPLVLVCPSPRRWALWARSLTPGADPADIDDDAVDTTAAYLADFLRALAGGGIDGLLLEEAAATEPTSAEALALYQPLFNLAAHYRWDVGLRLPQAAHALPWADGPSFVIAPRLLDVPVQGLELPASAWGHDTLPPAPAAGFRLLTVPADLQPETVLARLTAWR